MSSQTTDTPGTTTSNYSAVDRSGATFQTYPVSRSFANRRFRDFLCCETGPARVRRARRRTIFRLFAKGFGRYFSASAAATQKTIHGSKPLRKSCFGWAHAPRKPRNPGVFEAFSPCTAPLRHTIRKYGLAHITGSLSCAPSGLGRTRLRGA